MLVSNKWKPLLWILFVATVLGANWAMSRFDIVPIGFGIHAPAGVYFAGIAFTLRDLLHNQPGSSRPWIISAIIVGALLSAVVADAQRLALASATAFFLSEITDWAVYSPLRRKGWIMAVAASNGMGLLVDSIIFLSLAYGSLAFLEGQILGKAYMTLLAIGILAIIRAGQKAKSSF
jgi:uncharacterized PurR-regulated membrane protein YhhQ (DUF165 family)